MRPGFIPREAFRAYLTAGDLNKHIRIDGVMGSSYVQRCERENRPIPHRLHNGSRRWRLLDIVARARAHALTVEPPLEVALARNIESLRAERDALSAEVTAQKHRLVLQKASRRLTGAVMLTEAEIAEARLDLPRNSGVYFLLRGSRVVYVGQSVKVLRRVIDHLANKAFDGFAYVECEPAAMNALESLYIHVLRPELNGRWGSRMHAPVRLEALIGGARTDEKPRAT